jgi:hypothetical protein
MSKFVSTSARKLGLPVFLALVLKIVIFQWINTPLAGAIHAQAKPAVGPCVNPGGTVGCYISIQTAINAASSGDIVSVAAGANQEHIKMRDQVSVYGAGWYNTVIDGGYAGPTATITFDQVWAGTVLSGVQVTGGRRDLSLPLQVWGASISNMLKRRSIIPGSIPAQPAGVGVYLSIRQKPI